MTTRIPTGDIRFVRELYPRVREDEAAVERYQAAIDQLPPIAIARDGVLVDGYHRLLAHRREGRTEIEVENLGNLTDLEIRKESIRRNASHGQQLTTSDKRHNAELLYREGVRDYDELATLLSLSRDKARQYAAEARRDEVAEQKARAWDLWLDCYGYRAIEGMLENGPDEDTIGRWVSAKRTEVQNADAPPGSRQHFDIWNFQRSDSDTNYFGAMPPQVVENLLWFYTEPGQTVVDLFVGSGTTIEVAKRMGRRVWASDRKPYTDTLPIHKHDVANGWPTDAPNRADFILLDPPYWKQAAGRYSDDAEDLGNMTLANFMASWAWTVRTCVDHLNDGAKLAYIVSPAEDRDDNRVVDLTLLMHEVCLKVRLQVERRIIVPYTTQQATGQQVEWARENKKMLKLYRDLVVMKR